MGKNTKSYAIVAGGTGGHIIPSVVFGTWLEEKEGSRVEYYTGNRDLEKKIYDFFEKKPTFLPLSGSPRGTTGFSSLRRYMSMAYVTCRLFARFFSKPPQAFFLFGGYLCVPFIVAAKILGIPAVIHEQNVLAGKTTRFAVRLGIPVCTGWPTCLFIEKEKKIFSGIPVRNLQHLHVLDAWNKLVPGIAFPSKEIILVFGGSLGSSLLVELAFKLASSKDYADCHFLILSKEEACEGKKEKNITFLEPQWDMSPLYTVASAVIARGGGSTLAELLAYNVPGLIIPFAKSSDGHQEKNAQCFKDLGGGDFWRENEPFSELKKRLRHVLTVQRELPQERKSNGTQDSLPSRRIFQAIMEDVVVFP